MAKKGNDDQTKGGRELETGSAVNPDKLKVKLTEGQSWTRFLTIEVPSEDVDKKFLEVFGEYRSQAKIPGFRPGKAPMSLIEKKFSNEVRGEVLESLIDEAYKEAVIQKKIWPLSNPSVSEIEFEKNKPLKFKAEIEIRPEVKLKKYKGFRIEKKVREVTEKDVEDSIKYMCENMAELETVERPAIDGDQVRFDLLKKFDKLGKLKEDKLDDVEAILGSEGILKEFHEGLMGMSLGEMKDIKVKYPDNYYDKNLAGDEITYTAVIKEIKKRTLPEVNDELVAKISSHKTVDEFRNSLRENLEKQAQNEATKNMRYELIDRTVKANSFDVPTSLLNKYLDSVVEDYKSDGGNVDEETVRRQYRPVGENMIRWNFLYYEIASAENIKVTQEDRAKWVHDFAVAHNLPVEKAREALAGSKRQQNIDDSIIEAKVLELIIENSEIIEN